MLVRSSQSPSVRGSGMRDVIGGLIVELRSDTTIGAIVGNRVRGQEDAQGDVRGSSEWQAHIRIVTLATPRMPRVPVQRARYAINCYGRSKEEASDLYEAASDLLHGLGPRELTGGYWAYVSHDDTGGSFSTDPDTKQPAYTFVLELLATTQAVTA